MVCRLLSAGRGPLRRRGHGLRLQPGQLTTVPLGQYRREDKLRRDAGWRGRGYLRDDVAGDPVGHLIPHHRVQLRCAGKKLASNSACSARSPDSCSVDAHHASWGGISGGGVSRGARSLITTVPANTSPRRLPVGESRLHITAGPPERAQISTNPASARNTACRKRSGPPSSDTTRSPRAILPNDLPRVAVSNAMGYAKSVTTVKMIGTAAESAESNCVKVVAHNSTPMM